MIIIKDPILEPFYVGKDAYNYTVFETVPATLSGKGRRKKDAVVEFDPDGKTYDKPLGYYTTLGNAIGAIAKQKTPKTLSFNSLKEYMDELKSINQETQNLINKINL
jgi:hypothetical protein